MPQIYNDPAGGSASTIGSQARTDFFNKKALVEAAKEQYFGQLADVTAMPKNMGKKIKRFHYLPLLSDANINDQGIDAAGASTAMKVSIQVTRLDGAIPKVTGQHGFTVGAIAYFVGEGANAAAAGDAAVLKVNQWMEAAVLAGGLGLTLVGGDEDIKYVDGVNVTDGLAHDLDWRFNAVTTAAVDLLAVPQGGNLYGSSKDVGTIAAKLPTLTESGGRVNRVGFKRVEIEGTFAKFGFFDEYSKESLDFDTDAELDQHVTNEMVKGANEVNEDAIQIDLLNAAGVVRFGGDATKTDEITGEGTISSIDFNDLMRLSIDLDDNRTPKNTTIISGSRMVDTKVIPGARYMYIGSELIPSVKKMTDSFSERAFIPVEKYASAGNIARGEIGIVDQFRIIVVPEMMHWDGAGASVTTNPGYRESGGKYNVYPMLVIGSGSFTTIGFQTSGKTVKFKIKHVKPESNQSYSKDDPYGEIGFMSIKWYYGLMILRPERIALAKTVAEF